MRRLGIHKVLIIGSEGIGLCHLKGYERSQKAITSIVEPHEEKRKFASGTFDIAKQLDHISDVDLSKFDLAVICTPANTNLDLIRSCTQIDLSFMVEKPFAVTKAGIPELIDEIRAKKHVARVGDVRRVAKQVKALRKHNKIAATVCSPDTVSGFADMGYNLLSIGADVVALSEYADRMMTAFDRI